MRATSMVLFVGCMMMVVGCSGQPAAMLNKLDALHASLAANFSNLLGLANLFAPNATWIFPIGQGPSAIETGPQQILQGLTSWSSLLTGERSYMTETMVAGNQGSYWWLDVYSRNNGAAAPCMFQKRGFTTFNISRNNPAQMDTFVTWMDLLHANQQNVQCGLKGMAWVPPADGLEKAVSIISRFLTQGVVGPDLLSAFSPDAMWREPVGEPEHYVMGRDNIAAMLVSLNESYSWTSVIQNDAYDQTGIMLSGANAGFLQVITFLHRGEMCLYSVREFVSITIEESSGLISDFDVYFDRERHDVAKNRCTLSK